MKLDLNNFENSLDPDQLPSEEASWSGFTLFSTQRDFPTFLMSGKGPVEFGKKSLKLGKFDAVK